MSPLPARGGGGKESGPHELASELVERLAFGRADDSAPPRTRTGTKPRAGREAQGQRKPAKPKMEAFDSRKAGFVVLAVIVVLAAFLFWRLGSDSQGGAHPAQKCRAQCEQSHPDHAMNHLSETQRMDSMSDCISSCMRPK